MASADNGYYKLSWGERIVMDKSESANVKVSDLWMELVRNRPLRVLALFFIIAFTTMSISNAADSYFMTYNMGATPMMTTTSCCLAPFRRLSSCPWCRPSSAG